MQKTLHILTQNIMPEAIALSNEDILLTADAVYLVLTTLVNITLPKRNIFMLDNDRQARGIKNINSEIIVINISDMVAVLSKYNKSITW